MTLQGETIDTGAPVPCPDCRQVPQLGVYNTPAGYYVGTYCKCGPYSRESGYYRTSDEAQADLDSLSYVRP